MGRISTRHRIARLDLDNATVSPFVDTLLVEEPLEIRIFGEVPVPPLTAMRTPGHDLDLAVGLALAEGILAHPGQVTQAMHCVASDPNRPGDGPNVLQVAARGPLTPPPARTLDAGSACGVCGSASIDDVLGRLGHRLVPAPPPVTRVPVREILDTLAATQRAFASTGGSHAAAIFRLQEGAAQHLVTREDVGRHNAVDKVVGHVAQQGVWPLPADTVLATSSRAGFEILQKAWVAGIGTVITVSAASSLAVEVARAAGITLIGMVRRGRANVYTDGTDRSSVNRSTMSASSAG